MKLRGGASGDEAVDEAPEVKDVEDGRRGAVLAVGVHVSRCELVQEADKIVDVEEGRDRGVVAVGVAGPDFHAEVGVAAGSSPAAVGGIQRVPAAVARLSGLDRE